MPVAVLVEVIVGVLVRVLVAVSTGVFVRVLVVVGVAHGERATSTVGAEHEPGPGFSVNRMVLLALVTPAGEV